MRGIGKLYQRNSSKDKLLKLKKTSTINQIGGSKSTKYEKSKKIIEIL